MNIFKKLFSKKEINPSPSKYQNISIKVVTKEIVVPETNEILKDYDISEIKKQSTEIKNKDGFLAATIFIKDFVASNVIEFQELISLLKKVIPYMKKEKTIEDSTIVNYVETQIDKFLEKDDIEYQTAIAELYSRIDNLKAIEYLEKKLGDFETDKDKTLDHFYSIIQLSDFYLANKKGDIAFQTVQRATLLVTNFNDKFDYLWKQRILAEKSAAICLKGQKKPQYADYLHYEILAFILEIAKDVNSFPHLSSFFHRKNICLNNEWGFIDNDDFDKSLVELNIFNHKQDLINDIFGFCFNQLPIKMGIPIEYLKKDALEPLWNLTENFENKYPEWKKIMALQEKLKEIPFDISIPHEFSGEVIKKYYDIENKSN